MGLNESPKAPPIQAKPEINNETLQNGNLASKNVDSFNKPNLDNNCNNMVVNDYSQAKPENVEVIPRSPQNQERRVSKTAQEIVTERRRTSLKGAEIVEESACYRRVSISGSRSTPKKKAECGTHVVSKSELWDTGSQHRCSKSHQNKSRVSISQEEGRFVCFFI